MNARTPIVLLLPVAAALLVGCDRDGDGYGRAQDCDDQNTSVYPGAGEVCDGLDNDCDGVVDGPAAVARAPFYPDRDGDGFGGPALDRCPQGDERGGAPGDCDDTQAGVSPSATEVCDGLDNDCDGFVDTDAPDGVRFVDADGDGYAPRANPIPTCDTGAGTSRNTTDCDDSAAAVGPAATEACDSVDNDCDGWIDEGGAC